MLREGVLQPSAASRLLLHCEERAGQLQEGRAAREGEEQCEHS